MQHVKKRSCSRATHGGFLRPAREKIRPAEIAEKIWREKAPSLKDALVYWKEDPRVDAYIAKSADLARPIRATFIAHAVFRFNHGDVPNGPFGVRRVALRGAESSPRCEQRGTGRSEEREPHPRLTKFCSATPPRPVTSIFCSWVESKNMAAFDNAREKFDPIARKIEGTPDQQRQTATKRVEIREILGNKLMREITLK
jgi:hypothetical protein